VVNVVVVVVAVVIVVVTTSKVITPLRWLKLPQAM
jgi:hypothetical protein